MKTTAIILAAGQGTRMKSNLPKVLHKVAGKSMLDWVITSLDKADVEEKIVVLGHKGEQVEETLSENIKRVYQREQLGTGHAVMQAKEYIDEHDGVVLVLCGDTPLLRGTTIERLLAYHKESGSTVTILTAQTENPYGYGRIIRKDNQVQAIVEEKDASVEEKLVQEINTGTYCFDSKFLGEFLGELDTENAQGEYYLTDLIKLAVSNGRLVQGYILEDFEESLGINNRLQLAQGEKVLRRRKAEQLMIDGVTLLDPEHTYIDDTVEVGRDTIIYPNVIIEGNTVIGESCLIGANSRIVDSSLGDGSQVQQSIIVESELGINCNIGPFAYLRPGSKLGEQVKVGDFVEVKKSTVGKGSKIPHHSYIGDAIIGEGVNIGCGTITCNYDGVNKHQTIIEDYAFIGSNSNLVAPVTVGERAITAAGSTITKNVPPYALGVGRSRQENKAEWVKK